MVLGLPSHRLAPSLSSQSSGDDWGSLLAPQQHSLRPQQVVVVVAAVAVGVVAAVAVVVPHLVCLWWSEWTVMGGVLHCGPMYQQSTCKQQRQTANSTFRDMKPELQNVSVREKQNQVLQFALILYSWKTCGGG